MSWQFKDSGIAAHGNSYTTEFAMTAANKLTKASTVVPACWYLLQALTCTLLRPAAQHVNGQQPNRLELANQGRRLQPEPSPAQLTPSQQLLRQLLLMQLQVLLKQLEEAGQQSGALAGQLRKG